MKPDAPPEAKRATQPADTPTPSPFPFPPEADSPSSSSSSSSSDAPDAEPTPTEPAGPAATSPKGHENPVSSRSSRRHLPKVEDLERRESEDLEVSHYYVTTGNFLAAYLRAKDAVTVAPDDPEAHLALAQTAERLKKSEQAVAEYNLYLKLDPDGEKAKVARKALAGLSLK